MSKALNWRHRELRPVEPGGRRRRHSRVAVEPAGHVVVVELLAPQHAGECLTHHHRFVGGGAGRGELGVELVGLGAPGRRDLFEIGSQRDLGVRARPGGTQPQPQLHARARLDLHLVPRGALGAPQVGVHRRRARDDVIVDPVLGERGGRGDPVEALSVGFVVAEQQGRCGPVRSRGDHQLEVAEQRVRDGDGALGRRGELGCRGAEIPRPRVAEPERRQQVQRVRLGPGVGDVDRHQQIGRVGLRVVDLDDPVPVVVERTRVEQLVLGVVLPASAVLGPEILVGERGLRVVVAPAVPGVAGDGVEVPPVVLDVLTVVGLGPGQPERPLLEDRIAPVPQCQAQAQPLLAVAEAGQAVLAPAVGLGAGVVMRQVVPRLAVGAVILPDRAPLALAQIRTPRIPVAGLGPVDGRPAESVHALPLSYV